MKFIHAADLHVDSPLRGLERYEGAPHEQLRGATREAFERLVDAAIENEVDFVIIAGDLFDGKWRDMSTGLWTAGQLRRLADEEIKVFLLRGNHDAASQVRKAVSWPENVHEFSTIRPETIVDESLGVALHGQGFARQAVTDDLAAEYPDRVKGLFNIGVLHTSLTGDPNHDTYAATSQDVLVAKGYDYWALGHIHKREILRDDPVIAFSGNTQGRHVNEAGPKGCLLVEVGDEVSVRFLETSVLQWHRVEVALIADDMLDELYAKVEQGLAACHANASTGGSVDMFVAVRLTIRGACRAHEMLLGEGDWEEAQAEIRNRANGIEGNVWVEKIELRTAPPIDLDRLRQGADLMGELLRDVDRAAEDSEALARLAERLAPLGERAARELAAAGIDLGDPSQLQTWLRQAESLLVTNLVGTPR